MNFDYLATGEYVTYADAVEHVYRKMIRNEGSVDIFDLKTNLRAVMPSITEDEMDAALNMFFQKFNEPMNVRRERQQPRAIIGFPTMTSARADIVLPYARKWIKDHGGKPSLMNHVTDVRLEFRPRHDTRVLPIRPVSVRGPYLVVHALKSMGLDRVVRYGELHLMKTKNEYLDIKFKSLEWL